MKKLYIIITLALLLLPLRLAGQGSYRQAGIRAGLRGGLFYQAPSTAGNGFIDYQAMLGFSRNGIQLTGLRIIYETVLSDISPDIVFAWGYGGHAGFIVTDHINFLGEHYNFERDLFCPVIGADGWLAAEYRFRDIPLNISLNAKPYVELSIPAFVRLMPLDIGISVSYVF